MKLPEYKQLDIAHFQRLFDDMSECYKLFWFQAITDCVCAGKTVLTFDELINNMIADAWYMVSEYKLNLGPRDNLEALVHYAQGITGLKSSQKRDIIIDTIAQCDDSELAKFKRNLTYNVPYRLQKPFLNQMQGEVYWRSGGKRVLAERINAHDGLIYKFLSINGLDSIIEIDSDWAEYIKTNYEIIKGWIKYNIIQYLQRRNPNVPGIPNKLEPPQERKLELVKNYWKDIIEVCPVHDIYGDIELTKNEVSIDHFVPWSYVAHDELWNLSPTTRSINSRKSNHLPDWDTYFDRLCDVEYMAYQMVWQNEQIHKRFDKCLDEHVNSDEVRRKLYREGLSREEHHDELSQIVLPSYNAAKNLGFDNWVLK